ncbi:MAG: hypothetical protein RR310_02885 [Eubacterium sp.]
MTPSAATATPDTNNAPTPTTTVQAPVDNSAISNDVSQITPEMQAVIDANQADIFVDTNKELAISYPSNLLPLYKVSGVADSHDITSDKGNPGWTALYGSTAETTELTTFYQSFLGTAPDYTEEANGASTNLHATVNGCDIRITVSPNTPERTGLDYASSVNIFIEKVQ